MLLLLPGLAAAGVYRWVDENGVVHYGDRAPAGAERVDLPELQRMKSAAGPVETEPESAPEPETPAAPRIGIQQPRPEQTFRDPRGLVPAAVSLATELTLAQRLVYYLDGEPVAGPTRNLSLQLEGVPRGEHRLSVAIVAGDEEIARSAAVTFYMQPPSTLSPTGTPDGSAPTPPPSGPTQGAPGAPRPQSGSP